MADYTYFGTKKHAPLPTGVTTDEVMRLAAKVGELHATVTALAKTHPTPDNIEASKLLSACRMGMFKALQPKAQPIQTPSPTASSTPNPSQPDASVEESARMRI